MELSLRNVDDMNESKHALMCNLHAHILFDAVEVMTL